MKEADEIGLLDVMDNMKKYRDALGFVADKLDDPQASAAVWMIAEAMETTESMLHFIMQSGPFQELPA